MLFYDDLTLSLAKEETKLFETESIEPIDSENDSQSQSDQDQES